MTKRSWVQTLTMETIFQAPLIWIKAWNKNCGKLYPGIVTYAVIPKMGGWTLRNGQLKKIHLHGIE